MRTILRSSGALTKQRVDGHRAACCTVFGIGIADTKGMGERQTKQNHHFVPRFYLKRWEAADERLWAFRRENGRALKPKQYPVSQILYEKELYTVRGSQRDDVYFGEDEIFEVIDADAALVLEAVVDRLQKEISVKQRHALWRFMYTLQVRNPRTIRDLAASWPSMEEQIMKDLMEKYGPPIPGRPMLSEILGSQLDAGKFMAAKIAKDDHRYRDYFDVWSAFVFFKPPIRLFTSDYPFLAFPDFDAPTSLFVFPVAPNCCFLGFNEARMAPLFLEKFSTVQLADFVNVDRVPGRGV